MMLLWKFLMRLCEMIELSFSLERSSSWSTWCLCSEPLLGLSDKITLTIQVLTSQPRKAVAVDEVSELIELKIGLEGNVERGGAESSLSLSILSMERSSLRWVV